jgi:hypothetical protein
MHTIGAMSRDQADTTPLEQRVMAAWRRIRGHLPPRIVATFSAPSKRVVRRLGAIATSPATMRVNRQWPGIAERASDRIRLDTFSQLLEDGGGRTLLDLGAGPCWFARRAVAAGWSVTAVDARTERLPADLTGITFVQSDVRDFDPAGYDCIVIVGLLYHLTLAQQEALLTKCAYTRVIVETQVHTPGYVPRAALAWGYRMVRKGGYRGVVFPEGDNPMASIDNPTSFWHTEPSLLRMFKRCGYLSVTIVEPPHFSKYGTRKFYVLESRR